jgi:hypothetical protein
MLNGPAALVREFYALRRRNEPELLRPWLHPALRWCEPEVGRHMGVLQGPDQVIDMMHRALAATSSSFRLEVAATIETATHCSTVIHWSAEKPGGPVRGQEMAVYGFRGEQIIEAFFFAANLADDHAFWA